MSGYRSLRLFGVMLCTTLLAACGGGGGDDGNPLTPEPDKPDYELGTLDRNGNFREGELDIPVARLSASGRATVSVNVTKNGEPYSEPVDVSFISNCMAVDKANLETPITTVNGRATSVYQAQGCGTADEITARTTIEGKQIHATGVVEVANSSIGAIEWVSTEPQVIALRNTGGSDRPESALVTFQLKNSADAPLVGKEVAFTITPNGSDAKLSTETATSDGQGIVTARVRAGSVPTPLRVIARVKGSGIATQSSQLSVGTGLPSQNRFSLSFTTLNPEALNYDGVEVEATARLADQFGNPVPDGTTVNFTTEAGQIGQTCQTENGACSVTWTSADPRPADGRSSVLAYAVGEETLRDRNGNNLFDGKDVDAFVDISEAYRDDNFVGERLVAENGTSKWVAQAHSRDLGDPYIDYNGNGLFDHGYGLQDPNQPDTQNNRALYNGVLCQSVGGVEVPGCGKDTVHVFDQGLLVMSGSAAVIKGTHSDVAGGIRACSELPSLSLQNGGAGTVSLQITDVNGNPMPAGTTFKAETSLGSIEGKSEFTVPSTNQKRPMAFGFLVKGAGGGAVGDSPQTGIITVTVTTPGPGVGDFEGTETSCPIVVREAPPIDKCNASPKPSGCP